MDIICINFSPESKAILEAKSQKPQFPRSPVPIFFRFVELSPEKFDKKMVQALCKQAYRIFVDWDRHEIFAKEICKFLRLKFPTKLIIVFTDQLNGRDKNRESTLTAGATSVHGYNLLLALDDFLLLKEIIGKNYLNDIESFHLEDD